jgi:hypothetical protein
MIGVAFREFVEADLQASIVHPRQVKTKALSGRGLHRRVEVGPLVGASHDVGRAKPFRALAPGVPVDEPEKRASSKAKTFSGFPFWQWRSLICSISPAKFF